MNIRVARRDDLLHVQDIERRAGALFVDAGMPEIAEHPPPTIDELINAALLLVAVAGQGDDADRPIGYAWVEIVDGHAHLEQLSVLPNHGRRGVGTRLLDAVAQWALERGDHEVTLTTFRDIPFNAPMYARRGYVVIPADERPPGLVALVGEEASHGLDPAGRVAMRRLL